jgi:hypothetical protein
MKLCKEELHNLYSSNIKVIKLRIGWAGHVARMGREGGREGERCLQHISRKT